jgi:hypothetical protein
VACGYQHFGGNLTDDGGSRFLQNLSNCEAELHDFTLKKMILIQLCRVLVMMCDISKYCTYFGLSHHVLYVVLQKLALLPSSHANLSDGPSEIGNFTH